MGAAYFYHLMRRPLDAALPQLLDRALANGWRVAVRAREAARLDWLDERLWLSPEESFLPHGIAGGPQDADQPVLLTTGASMPNGAVCLMAVDGAEVAPEEVRSLERVCILFDGHDEAALGAARSQWKALTAAGCPAQYWAEDDSGRWTKKHER